MKTRNFLETTQIQARFGSTKTGWEGQAFGVTRIYRPSNISEFASLASSGQERWGGADTAEAGVTFKLGAQEFSSAGEKRDMGAVKLLKPRRDV